MKANREKKRRTMATIKEMAEAHLLNVQREVQNLSKRKAEIEQEIETLNAYLVEGSKTLQEVNSEASDAPALEDSPI
jgi:predicted  nucleic acid-binding Zn-ribbon protein|tara:strand:+ start:880 stop:1110 length:231 start_codon:yes stop_codon:yes gene_type:complete